MKKIFIIIAILFIIILLIPAVLFPGFEPIQPSGPNPVASVVYTIPAGGPSEKLKGKENRNLTMEIWYPTGNNSGISYPLILFSHGSFGYRDSNHSTFIELASHGYIVCSIDHTNHAIFTKESDGRIVIGNPGFLQDAMAVQSEKYEEEKIYELTHDWLDIRVSDMNQVLRFVLSEAAVEHPEKPFSMINKESIGAFGHSLGGAAAAQLGRVRDDIDGVIVLDGTLIGESIDFIDGEEIFQSTPYPIPILDIFNEEHYREALENSSTYANMVMAAHAIQADQIMIEDSGHLNFTDLPLFSPILAKTLGVGDIDGRYCIERMNQIVLAYFNYYLKGMELPELEIQE